MPFQKGHKRFRSDESYKKAGKKISKTARNNKRVHLPHEGFQKGNKLGEHPNAQKARFKKGGSPWNKEKKGVQEYSKERAEKIGKAVKKQWENGERKISPNFNNWRGGLSFEKYTTDWTETLKGSIRERDHYTCRLCSGPQIKRLHSVHHIDYDKKNCDPKNLITLCISCHMKTNYNRKKWIKYFKNLML